MPTASFIMYLFLFHSGCSSVWPKADWLKQFEGEVQNWLRFAHKRSGGVPRKDIPKELMDKWFGVGSQWVLWGFEAVCFVHVELHTFYEIESCKMCLCWTVVLLIWNCDPLFCMVENDPVCICQVGVPWTSRADPPLTRFDTLNIVIWSGAMCIAVTLFFLPQLKTFRNLQIWGDIWFQR